MMLLKKYQTMVNLLVGIVLLCDVIGHQAMAQTMTKPTTKLTMQSQHVVWRKAPIEVTLPIGQERMLSFPSEVQLGINTQVLSPHVLHVQNDNRTLYLLAKKPFSAERVEVKLVGTGEIILMDLKATSGANDTPIDVVLPKRTTAGIQEQASQTNQANVNYVNLTRFAVQALYAPKRLLSNPLGITRYPMATHHVVPLFWDNSALAMPLVTWRGGDLYVTAIQVKNLLHQPLKLDPRTLCGQWAAATFFPQEILAPHGAALGADTTTLFLISNRAFAQASSECQ